MSRNLCLSLTGLTIGLAIIISGCSPSTNLSLNFSPEDTASYKSVSEVVKDFRFEQPNIGKLREEQTKNTVEMNFTQAIESVDADGNATANITIDSLAVNIINKNETRLAFDSSKDSSSSLAKLIGQSYKIQITPAGDVTVLDAANALAAIPSGYENKIAAGILSNDSIIQRHQVPALPKEASSNLSVGKSWSQVVASPPGLLAPKSYKKTYTLSGISGNITTVSMVATEDSEPVKGAAAGMGMFAKMFDNEDNYKGSMTLNQETGALISSEETLVSTYLAQEMSEKGDPAKGPDTLTMQFTHKIKIEKLN
ncbi:MAG: hypothetical protein H8E62_10315 [Planctomycetes bacterium]|nr:hypothetical protein [Planctomycetota bacterium]